jgi:hypothetical protein
MLSMLLCLGLTAYAVPVEAEGDPFGEDPVFVLNIESEAGSSIALGHDPEDPGSAITGWALFPDLYNPAKASATYNADEALLSVYSQYPYSANYVLAAYRIEDDGSLVLLEGGSHDAYLERLEAMEAALSAADNTGVVDEAWSVMYPGGNGYPMEMSILLLQAGMAEARTLLDAGETPETAMSWMAGVDEAAMNLSNEYIHDVIPDRGSYPSEALISVDEYAALLLDYAELLDQADDPARAYEVREASVRLTE